MTQIHNLQNLANACLFFSKLAISLPYAHNTTQIIRLHACLFFSKLAISLPYAHNTTQILRLVFRSPSHMDKYGIIYIIIKGFKSSYNIKYGESLELSQNIVGRAVVRVLYFLFSLVNRNA